MIWVRPVLKLVSLEMFQELMINNGIFYIDGLQ
jgi:hypothetical protein